jgi:hypothetical protein
VKDYTSARPAEYVNPLDGLEPFRLDGELFHLNGEVSLLRLSDLARRVSAVTDPETAAPEVQAAMVGSMSETLLMAMGPAEYDRFLAHTDKNHTPDEVIIGILQDVNEAVQAATEAAAGRPTMPSSSSSTGSAAMDERTQRVISLQTGDVRLVPPPADHQPPKARGTARPRKSGGRRATG